MAKKWLFGMYKMVIAVCGVKLAILWPSRVSFSNLWATPTLTSYQFYKWTLI